MKKMLLLLLIAIPNIYSMTNSDDEITEIPPLASTRHSNYDQDDDNDVRVPKKIKKKWSTAQKFILGLMLTNCVGLGTDIASLKTSAALNNEVSPITAYPFKQGIGFPFSPQVGPERNPNCTYTNYTGNEWPTINFASAKGECPCNITSCACTVEECAHAESYKKYWGTGLATQISSIATRVICLVGTGLGTWIVYDSTYGLE